MQLRGANGTHGCRARLEKEFAQRVAASETSNEFQAKEVKFANLPEYYTAYKERPHDVAYLGASVVARVSLWYRARAKWRLHFSQSC